MILRICAFYFSMVASFVLIGCDSNSDTTIEPPSKGLNSYSAVADFSNTINNDTSVWSYRFSNDLNRDGSYQLLETYGEKVIFEPAISHWKTSIFANIGVNSLEQSAKYVGSNETFFWDKNTIWVHPPNGGLVVISWLSPKDGSINMDYSFKDIDPNTITNISTGVRWFVENGDSNSTLDSGEIDQGGDTGLIGLSNIAVKNGDRINFVVDPNGNYNLDSTGITVVINYVEE